MRCNSSGAGVFLGAGVFQRAGDLRLFSAWVGRSDVLCSVLITRKVERLGDSHDSRNGLNRLMMFPRRYRRWWWSEFNNNNNNNSRYHLPGAYKRQGLFWTPNMHYLSTQNNSVWEVRITVPILQILKLRLRRESHFFRITEILSSSLCSPIFCHLDLVRKATKTTRTKRTF